MKIKPAQRADSRAGPAYTLVLVLLMLVKVSRSGGV